MLAIYHNNLLVSGTTNPQKEALLSTHDAKEGLTWVNKAPALLVNAEFTALLGSTPLADRLLAERPFPTLEHLLSRSSALLRELSKEQLLEAINAHPPIGATVVPGSHSAREQSTALAAPEALQTIAQQSATYREQFGYEFLIRAKGRTSSFIASELARRLLNDPATEWNEAVDNLDAINAIRLTALCEKDSALLTTLSVHCLNTTTGVPARELSFTLYDLTTDEAIAAATTNTDGRFGLDFALRQADYRIRFDTGAYFEDAPHLYPYVDIAFRVDAATGPHIHIPLLLSPFGYSTYRGS